MNFDKFLMILPSGEDSCEHLVLVTCFWSHTLLLCLSLNCCEGWLWRSWSVWRRWWTCHQEYVLPLEQSEGFNNQNVIDAKNSTSTLFRTECIKVKFVKNLYMQYWSFQEICSFYFFFFHINLDTLSIFSHSSYGRVTSSLLAEMRRLVLLMQNLVLRSSREWGVLPHQIVLRCISNIIWNIQSSWEELYPRMRILNIKYLEEGS